MRSHHGMVVVSGSRYAGMSSLPGSALNRKLQRDLDALRDLGVTGALVDDALCG